MNDQNMCKESASYEKSEVSKILAGILSEFSGSNIDISHGPALDTPLYLKNRVQTLEIQWPNASFLVVYIEDSGLPMKSIRSFYNKLVEKMPEKMIALGFPSISKKRFDAIMRNQIPFITLRNQIFFPFLGLLWKEKWVNERESDHSFQKWTPAVQAVIAYLLNSPNGKVYRKDIIEQLGFTKMTISRAVKILSDQNFITEKNKGTSTSQIEINFKTFQNKDWKKYAVSPVIKTAAIPRKYLPAEALLSGDSALAKYSMLASPAVQTYALPCYPWIDTLKPYLISLDDIDSQDEVKVEFWSYNPDRIFNQKKTDNSRLVDSFSLLCKYLELDDPRVEEAVLELEARLQSVVNDIKQEQTGQ